MSITESFKYVCKVCKKSFRYNNQCRCKMCHIKIDADICLSCHNNSHVTNLYVVSLGVLYLMGVVILRA